MSDLIVALQRVIDVKPHPNADRLEVAVILGWEVITQKGNVQPGDTVLYIPPDAMLPRELADKWGVTPYLSWMKNEEKGRVRAASIRSYTSYGFSVPASKLDIEAEIGEDLKAHFGIDKYEPPERLDSGDMEQENILFHKFTDIQRIQNYPEALFPGEEVVATEKLHGCLQARSRVTMADFSVKEIKDIVIGDWVLGLDPNGKAIPTLVTNVFNNGLTEDWLRVKGPRIGMGRGNSFFSITCTPQHLIYTTSFGYVPANKLDPNLHKVVMHRSEMDLTNIQKQVILGKLLGDGSLRLMNSSAIMEFSHILQNEDYVDYCMLLLGGLSNGNKDLYESGYGSEILRSQTISSFFIKHYFSHMITDCGKQVSDDTLEFLSPLSIAIWYMDDGCRFTSGEQEDRAGFAVCGFSEESVDCLISGLNRFGIEAKKSNNSDGYARICLNSDASDKLWMMISPYICKSMQYKLPERYQSDFLWEPNQCVSEYKTVIVEQEINSIEKCGDPKQNRSKYDIETETHNFFANGIVVHNSSSRVGIVVEAGENGEPEWVLCIGSSENRRKLNEGSLYYVPVEDYGAEKLIAAFDSVREEGLRGSVILFGEIFGGGVQGKYVYGSPKKHLFRAFDLAINGKYVDYDVFLQFCEGHGIMTVPELYRGPYDFEAMKALCQGQSTLDTHIREGIVVKPVKGRLAERRPVYKFINPDYETKKDNPDSH